MQVVRENAELHLLPKGRLDVELEGNLAVLFLTRTAFPGHCFDDVHEADARLPVLDGDSVAFRSFGCSQAHGSAQENEVDRKLLEFGVDVRYVYYWTSINVVR